MPCNSNYMNPTLKEINRRETSELICYVNRKLNLPTPTNIIEASQDIYGQGVELDEVVSLLCEKISSMTEQQKESIVYNAKNKTSRKLADWWEEHVEADKRRLKMELEEKKKKETMDEILKKLTPSEKEVLGLN